MSSIEETLTELVDDILQMFQLAESRSAALLQLLKDKGIVSDDELAPYLEQAANASSVKRRAARVRFESSIKSATKGIDEVAQQSAKKAVEESLGHDNRGEGSKEAKKEKDKERVERAESPESQSNQAPSSEHRASDDREPERPKVDATVRDNAA